MDKIEELAQVFKAFADPTRLRLLKLLHQNARVAEGAPPHPGGACNGARFLCVNAMARRLGVTQSAVSQHLRILKQVGLVTGERHGSFMHYSLDAESLSQYGDMLKVVLGVSFSEEGISG